MNDFVKKFPGTGVLVIGDLMVDRYIWGNVNRISPEAPVPVVEVSKEDRLLGGAANVANNISSLGGRTYIIGVIGDDERGRVLLEMLKNKGINAEGIITVAGRPTTVKTRIYAHDQQVVRFDREIKDEIDNKTISLVLERVKRRLPEIKAIILSDYCKGVITKKLVKKLLETIGPRVLVAVDPKIGHFGYYIGVSIITPNIHEASFGSGVSITDTKSLISAGEELLRKHKCKSVLITRGGEGMTLFEKKDKITHIPTYAKEVYDVTGAGDTVIAAFTLCHAAGAGLKEAAKFANHAAGIVVGEVGTAVVTPQEIKNSIRKNKPRKKTQAR
ncbi:MAG TPA: D-glycero-beta-D-manno-heptose-7-phosphate kinase [Nitrospirae bacterium]|nr:bifunctional protein HldE [bacterium BMS3Abin10]GBE40054.1 bifunctional protein HldE [bacterium BMS3Bbin08]HDH50268.1 D-glycero-beta-D-manno-heptose-7-phosphate kinase [Nitrospirota bacterium]HDK17170.1 D-glycero-beta-D-manno-heptose-7-phosphate kinase [Nitrospirota bacterium]HDK41355.1 D-glycero-beta-D-manno-heptose-7-phosphate kinase [Nitrospirota bacterium]